MNGNGKGYASLEIDNGENLDNLSSISAILSNRVIVEGSEKHSSLNEGSILWITETRLPLGRIDEIFGPVKNPFYVVWYNSDEEVPQGISIGVAISFVVDFANHILNEKYLYENGYDASGIDDEEAADEVEFSDDEKEAEYKRSLRQSKRDANYGKQGTGFGKKANYKGLVVKRGRQCVIFMLLIFRTLVV
ncbi:H/ACA ribonucleoprotein complex non-core subunit NAF1-like [Asparagus officinalis]|uniref:H/ACA ribonucleoprotein complex non-core subunit NAF1-like n=1 Tax=Asparagus officinalis TaxID=4686 RepID=UPI00098DF473|nr:H/ACA ribonucleoprotein complex non-core subunit NAF1-like [Asparagus officinalis]